MRMDEPGRAGINWAPTERTVSVPWTVDAMHTAARARSDANATRVSPAPFAPGWLDEDSEMVQDGTDYCLCDDPDLRTRPCCLAGQDSSLSGRQFGGTEDSQSSGRRVPLSAALSQWSRALIRGKRS